MEKVTKAYRKLLIVLLCGCGLWTGSLIGAVWLCRDGMSRRVLLFLAAVLLVLLYISGCLGLQLYRLDHAQDDAEPLREQDSRLFGDLLHLPSTQLQSEVMMTKAQMASLQEQINPHFLYNTLESIRSKALIHDEEEIANMIETLALLFRYNISRGEKESSIEDEIKNVKNYVRIQNYRFHDKFSLELDLDELGELTESYRLPTLTLQPLVENAIHHGLEPKIEHGTIWIRGLLSEQNLILEIRDNGVGMDAARLDMIRSRLKHPELEDTDLAPDGTRKKHNGIAIRNIYQRLRLALGTSCRFEINSAQGVGTQILLYLPPVGVGEGAVAHET